MSDLDLVVETRVSTSLRARQLCGMFDVPPEKKMRLQWKASVPLDEKPWNVGLIVGPSGAGKSQCARALFGDLLDTPLEWGKAGVIDDFAANLGIEEIANACSAVGFNTIPSWLRPYHVLSNGERFRVDLARRLLELPDPVVVDEFSSVVDRQVAKIGSHAVQKWARKHDRKFVAVSCHEDIVDWLQPDWVFQPATATFLWRSLQRRPGVSVSIGRLPRAAWPLFAPYHYMSAALPDSCRCFGLWVEGKLASFLGAITKPGSGKTMASKIWGVSRTVTLPDYQGLGLAFVIADALGAALADLRMRFRHYPAHPSFVRAFDRSPRWRLLKKPGKFASAGRDLRQIRNKIRRGSHHMRAGMRPCAVFEYCGPAAGEPEASARLWDGGMVLPSAVRGRRGARNARAKA